MSVRCEYWEHCLLGSSDRPPGEFKSMDKDTLWVGRKWTCAIWRKHDGIPQKHQECSWIKMPVYEVEAGDE
jgi:hypothetical protein